MTTAAPVFREFVDRLNEASAELAAEAERQGISRAEAAAALAAEVQHAATRDAELEAMRERHAADLVTYQADAAAYAGRTTGIRDKVFELMEQLVVLADNVTAITDEAVVLDARGQSLADQARSLGLPGIPDARNFEDMIQRLKLDPTASLPMMRILIASRRGRTPTIAALSEAAQFQRREP